MADKLAFVDSIKDFWHSQYNNPEKWDSNVTLLRALGLFAGSIVFMRQFGDIMAI